MACSLARTSQFTPTARFPRSPLAFAVEQRRFGPSQDNQVGCNEYYMVIIALNFLVANESRV